MKQIQRAYRCFGCGADVAEVYGWTSYDRNSRLAGVPRRWQMCGACSKRAILNLAGWLGISSLDELRQEINA